jgi:hypothetical protein
MLMRSFQFVLTTAADFIPGVGRVLDASSNMLTTTSPIALFLYPGGEDPEGAFNWWVSPCGGTDMVPDDFEEAFDVVRRANGIDGTMLQVSVLYSAKRRYGSRVLALVLGVLRVGRRTPFLASQYIRLT